MSSQTIMSRIGPVRDAVLALHRVLFETERIAWQQINGQVVNSAELLQLAIHDPWFAWLRPLTTVIAAMDEAIADGDPEAEARVPELLAATRTLLHPDEDGSDFQQRYFDFIQRSPDVAVAHGDVSRKLRDAV
ncbi:MAG TPA: hypothetical protein VHW65_12450 [Gemmatimonadales bacterium]|jgi:hypothetical protein|nr:hypothetical protein [Gemmatimonadales bacterium]